MQEDLIRSILEDAQEPAPAGAWKAISSRLDAIASGSASPVAARSFRRVWAWGGAALAMAASIALGVFFLGTRDNGSGVVELASGESLVAEAASFENSEIRQQSVPETPTEAPVAESRQQSMPETPAEVPAAETRQQNVPETPTEAPAAETRQQSMPETSAETAPKNTADHFAIMAKEDAAARNAAKRRTSLLFGGSATGNSASASSVALAAPGAYALNSITEKSKSNFGIPLTFSIGVRYPLNDRLSVACGLDWSLLTRTFEGIYDDGLTSHSGDIRHNLQYIGIPLDLFASLLNTKDLRFYAKAGLEAEYAISNKYSVIGTNTSVRGDVSGLQWSAGAGVGVEFFLGKRTGLFLEPDARYYFDCGQPKSIRTEKPFMLMMRAGLRFDI